MTDKPYKITEIEREPTLSDVEEQDIMKHYLNKQKEEWWWESIDQDPEAIAKFCEEDWK